MKVVILGTRGFPNVQGGVEKHCEKLAVCLVEIGCEVIVITRKPYVDPKVKQFKGVKLKTLFAARIKSLEALLHTLSGILVAMSLKPDILHIQAIGPGLFTPLARLLGMKVVVTSHGSNYNHLKWGSFARYVLRVGELCAACFAHRMIAISKFISDDISHKYRTNPVIIPNGVTVKKPSQKAALLNQLGLTKRRYILTVGRLVPDKGIDLLMEAFLAAGLKNWHLVIVGAADHKDAYSRNLIEKASKNNSFVMTGQLTEKRLHVLYSHAGLFVLPSFYEGLPLVLLEAMSYGLPCITSDIDGNRAVQLDQDRYFKPGCVDALCDKIKHYARQPINPAYALAQIQYVADNFEWKQVARKTMEVYKSIAVRPREVL